MMHIAAATATVFLAIFPTFMAILFLIFYKGNDKYSLLHFMQSSNLVPFLERPQLWTSIL